MMALFPIKKQLRTDLSHSTAQSAQALISKHLHTFHTFPKYLLSSTQIQVVHNIHGVVSGCFVTLC